MIKAVIFDIDNTLYDYDAAHALAWAALCDYAKNHLNMDYERFSQHQAEAARIVEEHLGAACAALHDRTLRLQILLEENDLPLYHALNMSELYWDRLLQAAEPNPGAASCLSELKQEGYLLGIGTDMTVEYQLKKLFKLQLLPYFDFVVTSEEANVEKPDCKLFQLCAQKAGVSPQECLFIGDNINKDILGAINAEMHALWYHPSNGSPPEHHGIDRIDSFDQITDVLTQLNNS